ncbi:hypothetical protein EJB05_20118 [Eragrostis curvula]|uniref:Phytocyanin domain-containing protein n=1 Tax=Eragrostis curvula TaxID=38414 RepID=A0A5J9UY79_9POAL|nr:hypothetical protein EJB05_20118 [Eragrostis curvula]
MASRISCSALAVLLLLVASACPAAATSYTVGDGSGWTTGADYTSWAASKNFKVGDSLVRKGAAHGGGGERGRVHGVHGDQPDQLRQQRRDDRALKTPGSHYFVCSIPGHCSAGMKLAVTVGGSSTPSPTTPTTPTTSPTTGTPYTTPTTGTPYTTTPYTTTPTSPACTGGTYGTPVTPTTPGSTPFMSYPSTSGLGSAALAGFGLVWFVIVQLALLA